MRSALQAQIIFLGTHDLDKTSEFYEQILGLRLTVDQGSCRIYQVAHGAVLGFCARNRVRTDNDVVISLVTEDVHGLYEELKLQGVQIEQEPVYSPEFKIYHCFFRDPNGYRLEAQCFEDRGWMHFDHGV